MLCKIVAKDGIDRLSARDTISCAGGVMMKNMRSTIVILLLLCVLLYALEYIESSSGLQTPQLEAGRTEVEFVDIDADGNIDIISIGDHGSPYVNTQEHGIMVWFGDGTGNWDVYQNGNFGYGGIAAGDLNNDGFLDIGYGMHHNYSGNDFGDSILETALGDGTGQNWLPWDDGISTGNVNQWGMFCTDLADVNNDGLLDLGANSFGAGDGVHIFLNNGDGTWSRCFGFLGGNSTMDFCFGDVDADGNADFTVAHEYGTVYLGDGSGGFSIADGNLPSGSSVGRKGPSLGDVDNDGDQDIAFCNANGGVEVWAWQGNDMWSDLSGLLPATGSYDVTQICDMNIDGFMDVIAFGSGITSVWLGDGGGYWTADAVFTTPAPGDYAAFRVGVDADHNGYPDLALVAEEGDTWSAINHLRFFKETSGVDSLFAFPVYPRGGEVFKKGSVRYIKWTCAVPAGQVVFLKLELSTSGISGPWAVAADSVPDNGRYQFSVPDGVNSTNCYVRYTAMTSIDTFTCMTPAAFTISDGTGMDLSDVRPEESGSSISVAPSVGNGFFSVRISTEGGEFRRVVLYDRSGKFVRELLAVNGSGKFVVPWDRKDFKGDLVAAGTYFVRILGGRDGLAAKIVVVD
jgi:hypothetical protein